MKRIRHSRIMLLAALLLAALLASACNGQESTAVNITLREWAVSLSPATAPAGTVTFEVSNQGTEVHEFVIIKTDLGLLDLPVADDGSVTEEGEGIEVIDEIEDLAAGKSETLKVELAAGNYVFICNILETTEAGKHESHYQMGMRTSFKVT